MTHSTEVDRVYWFRKRGYQEKIAKMLEEELKNKTDKELDWDTKKIKAREIGHPLPCCRKMKVTLSVKEVTS